MRTCAIFGGSFDKFGIEDMKNRKKNKMDKLLHAFV